jgi:hypothetical protein
MLPLALSHVESRAVAEVILAAIDALPAAQREVLVLRDLDRRDARYSCWSTTLGAIVAALIAGKRVASSAALPSTAIVAR